MVRIAITASMFLLVAVAAGAQSLPSGKSLDGEKFEAVGHVTIVNYWATWCAPCRAEMPILDAFYRKHQAKGLAMVAISLDDGASRAKLREVTSAFAFPVARIADVKMPRKDIPRALPVTRIYDRSGKLIYASKGDGRSMIDAATLERVVSPLLATR
jgi:cytochrome c biogenesis protein CcmG, thiol:disulfide interchange protein DsbE